MKNIEWLTIFVFTFGLFSLSLSGYFAYVGAGFKDYSYGIMIGLVLLVTAFYYHKNSMETRNEE